MPPWAQGFRGGDPASALLHDNANLCSSSLQSLKTLANQKTFFRRPSSTSDTLTFLNEQSRRIADLVGRFQVWRQEIGGPPFPHRESVNAAIVKLGRLKTYTDNASRVLNRRVSLYTFGTRLNVEERKECEDLFDGYMKVVETCIGDLNSLSTRIRRPTPPIQVNQERTLQTRFMVILRGYPSHEVPNIPLSEISMLWDEIDLNETLKDHVENTRDPGDGLTYAVIERDQAKRTLNAMYLALRSVVGADHMENGLKDLVHYKNICVILKHMHSTSRKHFEAFLRHGKYELPFEEEELRTIVGSHERNFISSFYAEQYRIVPRKWPEDPGEILLLDCREPLPFKINKPPREGAFGLVYEVLDIFTKEILVHKSQRFKSEYVKSHFLEEIKILKKLLGVRHVVKLRRSYYRDGRYGFLLQPGKQNLHDLLSRISEKKLWQQQHVDREILKIFGCLCWSLSKIHAQDIRHKDIKPGNIVHNHYMKGKEQIHEYFIIDFSVAYDFHNDVDSRQQFQTKYSPQYAAPEIMRAVGNQQIEGVSDPIQASEARISGAGTKSDVFSLGIVFLEILSVFMGEPYLIGEQCRQALPHTFCSFRGVHNHLPELQAWIVKQIEILQKRDQRRELIPIFQICSVMIQNNQNDRYSAKEAAVKLSEANKHFFCPECLVELQSLEQAPIEAVL